MRGWVRDKLEQLDARFPAARVAASRERWRRLWAGEPFLDRVPFLCAPVTFNYYDAVHTPEERLRASLDEFILRGRFQDDFVPAFFPGCRQGTIPNLFGAVERVVDGDYTCDRLIRERADIWRLPDPLVRPGTIAAEWLALERFLLEETEGRIPVHVADMQGPGDVCGQLWGYDAVLAAAYDDPEAYHALMGRATEAFIGLWRAQAEGLGQHFVGTHLFGWDWVPPGCGASLSADSLVMLSPAFYEEFYQPYLERIATAFGGLAVHSCGQFGQVVPALCRTPGLKAVNASQMSVRQLLAAGLMRDTLLIVFAGFDDAMDTFALLPRERLRVDLTVAVGWPTAGGCPKPETAWTAADADALRQQNDRLLAAAAAAVFA